VDQPRTPRIYYLRKPALRFLAPGNQSLLKKVHSKSIVNL